MRPRSGNVEGQPRTRKTSPPAPSPPTIFTRSHSPVTFFLRHYSDDDRSNSSSKQTRAKDASTFTRPNKSTEYSEEYNSICPSQLHRPRQRLHAEFAHETCQPLLRPCRSFSGCGAESPQTTTLTPPVFSSAVTSSSSSPRSLSTRLSEAESTHGEASTLPISLDEDQETSLAISGLVDGGPQLVMPSIRMPSRRPFTARGKQMGNFKILIAGSKGVGKSSLIKSLVQTCEDIVHVDPLPHNHSHNSRITNHGRYSDKRSSQQTDVSEVYASTKPFPCWRSETEDKGPTWHRLSAGDSVLERNLCFVDTRGQEGALSMIIRYLELQLQRAIEAPARASHEFASLLGGSGGSQVDVVFYILSKDTLSVDLAEMETLLEMTNVIPLISKSDLLTTEETDALKAETRSRLRGMVFLETLAAEICYLRSGSEPNRESTPYTVSSVVGPDHETMEASLLMSPDYVQPLMPSELPLLVEKLFDPSVMSCLRHQAATKLVSWGVSRSRKDHFSGPSLPVSILPQSSFQPAALCRSVRSASPDSSFSISFSRAVALAPFNSEISLGSSEGGQTEEIADAQTHMTRLIEQPRSKEQSLRTRLTGWSNDLQSRFQEERERERSDRLSHGESAFQVMERWKMGSRDGQVAAMGQLNRELLLTPGSGRPEIDDCGPDHGQQPIRDQRVPHGGANASTDCDQKDRQASCQKRSYHDIVYGPASCFSWSSLLPLSHLDGLDHKHEPSWMRATSDSLNLLRSRLDQTAQNRAWITVQIIGGLGVLGGLAFWMARYWASAMYEGL